MTGKAQIACDWLVMVSDYLYFGGLLVGACALVIICPGLGVLYLCWRVNAIAEALFKQIKDPSGNYWPTP